MKIRIGDLSLDALKKVFAENSGLREAVYEDAQEAEMMWVGEHIDYYRSTLSDWQISGANYRDYINVKQDVREFAEKVREADENIVGYLENFDTLDKLDAKIAEADELDSDLEDYDDVYENLMEEAYAICDRVASELVSGYNRMVNYVLEYDHALEYFLDFYAENRLDEDCYVLANEDGTIESYELLEDTTTSYKEVR